MTYVIAFDFESFGPIPNIHGFTQLGAVIGNLNSGNIVDTFNEYANQIDYTVDSDCIESFWLRNPKRYQETLTMCSNSTNHPHEVIELFLKWIEKHTNERGSSMYLITDCSTYDSGILKAFSMCSTLKIISKSPRDIICLTSFYLGVAGLFMTEDVVDGSSFDLARKKLDLKEFKSSVSADHNPVNDATVIFEKFKFINDGLLEQ